MAADDDLMPLMSTERLTPNLAGGRRYPEERSAHHAALGRACGEWHLPRVREWQELWV